MHGYEDNFILKKIYKHFKINLYRMDRCQLNIKLGVQMIWNLRANKEKCLDKGGKEIQGLELENYHYRESLM